MIAFSLAFVSETMLLEFHDQCVRVCVCVRACVRVCMHGIFSDIESVLLTAILASLNFSSILAPIILLHQDDRED